jgi:hypothetical protein
MPALAPFLAHGRILRATKRMHIRNEDACAQEIRGMQPALRDRHLRLYPLALIRCDKSIGQVSAMRMAAARARFDCFDIVWVVDDAFAIQQARRQGFIVAGGSHRCAE